MLRERFNVISYPHNHLTWLDSASGETFANKYRVEPFYIMYIF